MTAREKQRNEFLLTPPDRNIFTQERYYRRNWLRIKEGEMSVGVGEMFKFHVKGTLGDTS